MSWVLLVVHKNIQWIVFQLRDPKELDQLMDEASYLKSTQEKSSH